MEQRTVGGNVFDLEKIDGKKLIAKITAGNKIAEGGLADVYIADVELGNRKIPFVFKRYRSVIAERSTKKAFANYKQAKEAGLKVFKTFRLVKVEIMLRAL